MDRTPDPWAVPLDPRPYRHRETYMQDSSMFKAFFLVTYIIALIFFIVSVYGLFSPAWGDEFSKASPFYLFFLLLNTPVIGVNTFWLNVGMVILYSAFFAAILYFGLKRWKGPAINNPIVFYGSMASFGLLLSLIIVIIEMSAGIPIGGTSLENSLVSQPYLSFVNLIYAPYAEEFGFRILPLGLISVYYVVMARGTRLDTLAAFVMPGMIRKKYGLGLTAWDYTAIVATSILFGAAHYLLGAWDPGKIISATFVGFILAFGFMKFGLFVDIPIHWFFNGFTSVYSIVPAATDSYVVALLWVLLSGAMAIVFLIVVGFERRGDQDDAKSARQHYPFS